MPYNILVIIHRKKYQALVDSDTLINYMIPQFIKKQNFQALFTRRYNLIKVRDKVTYIVTEKIRGLELTINSKVI